MSILAPVVYRPHPHFHLFFERIDHFEKCSFRIERRGGQYVIDAIVKPFNAETLKGKLKAVLGEF